MAELPQHLHSAAYFGDWRDHWWNADYLALLVRRLGLGGARAVLDAGSGLGHWGRALLPHLPEARLTGIDREPRWVAIAEERAAAFGSRASYRRGDVRQLDFPDESFDLVTCQTLLIHLPDVPAALREMVRVTRRGGTVLVVEPNNLASALVRSSCRLDEPIEELLEWVRFQATCERGKVALGEGDNSIGDRLPGMFVAAGLLDVRVSLSERALALVPPYEGEAARAMAEDLLEQDEKEMVGWYRHEVERWWAAAGADLAELDALWPKLRAKLHQEAEAVRAGTYHCANGHVGYLVSGRRPD